MPLAWQHAEPALLCLVCGTCAASGRLTARVDAGMCCCLRGSSSGWHHFFFEPLLFLLEGLACPPAAARLALAERLLEGRLRLWGGTSSGPSLFLLLLRGLGIW